MTLVQLKPKVTTNISSIVHNWTPGTINLSSGRMTMSLNMTQHQEDMILSKNLTHFWVARSHQKCPSVMLHTRSWQFPITLWYFQSPYSLHHLYNDQYHFGNNPKHQPQRYRHCCCRLGDLKHMLWLTTVGFASGNLSLSFIHSYLRYVTLVSWLHLFPVVPLVSSL